MNRKEPRIIRETTELIGWVIVFILLTAVATIVLFYVTPTSAEGTEPKHEKVTICHVAGRADDPANKVTLTLDEHALRGHFDENGTPQAGHEQDTFGPCAETPPPTEEPEPEPEPKDICPNLAGPQPELPIGYVLEGGDCIKVMTELPNPEPAPEPKPAVDLRHKTSSKQAYCLGNTLVVKTTTGKNTSTSYINGACQDADVVVNEEGM